jgi:hypothetical protein
VGSKVVQLTERLVELVVVRNGLLRAARNVVGGMALHLSPIAERVAGALSGIGIHYPAPAGAHELVGQRVSDIALDSDPRAPQRLYEALRNRKPVVLCSTAEASATAEVIRPWANRVDRACVRAKEDQCVMLVRPDGYVAWASDQRPSAERDDALASALTRWCGVPGKADLRVHIT